MRAIACLTACILAAPSVSRALPYEIFIQVDSEEDLYDLRVSGQISAPTFDALLLLYQTKVDLNAADRDRLYALPNLDFVAVDRILRHRVAVGRIESVEQLVAAGVLDERRARAIAPFSFVAASHDVGGRPTGFARVQTVWTGRYDRLPPASAAQGRVRALGHLDSGVVAVLARNDVGDVRWDPSRQALSVAPERVRVVVPKLYVAWAGPTWEVVAGTYRIGFGQSLTFDVTDQITPNGFFGDLELRRSTTLGLGCRRSLGELATSPCPRSAGARVTPDFQWTNRLTGAAIGATKIEAGPGWAQFYAWGSYQLHRVLQTEVVDRGRCPDPRRDDLPDCRAPTVHVRQGDSGAPRAALRFGTLPGIVAEALGGLHFGYFLRPRTHVGATGYLSFPLWRVEDATLDYQESARRPFGGRFGAVGIDAAHGFGRQDFFVEITRSFDGQPNGGGGFGAVARSVTDLARSELDLAVRYYGARFANPYARPVAAPDELDGLRARDEVGARLRTTSYLAPRVSLRTVADVWRRVSERGARATAFARIDVHGTSAFAWASWVTYRTTTTQQFTWAARFGVDPGARIGVAAQYQHAWVDIGRGPQNRQDLATSLHLFARLTDSMRIRVRVRYDFEDIANRDRLAQVWWALAEVATRIRDKSRLRIRYDFRWFVDHRASTADRLPNPEHWLWLEYVFRF